MASEMMSIAKQRSTEAAPDSYSIERPRYIERLVVTNGESRVVVPVERIDCIVAHGA